MDLKSEPLVSVVTPVYNTEKYLAECIESVLAQTYQNWEYVIVNNCSTDRSLEIAQRYAQQDDRIRVHDNDEFLKQFQNWNHAMRQISPDSKYCKVLHADDWLFPECIARMVEVAEAYPSVGIVSAYRLDEDIVNLARLPYPSNFMSGRKVCRSILLDRAWVFGSPTSLLIRSDIVRSRDKFYDESVIHSDTDACFDIMQDHDFGFVHQVLTFTRRHNESMTSRTHRFGTRRLCKFIVLLRHGPVYLTEEEYEECLKRALEDYHEFLASGFFELKGREFWTYHRNELRKLGYPLDVTKLIKRFLLQLLDFRHAFRSVRYAIQERKGQGVSPEMPQWDTVLGSIYSRQD